MKVSPFFVVVPGCEGQVNIQALADPLGILLLCLLLLLYLADVEGVFITLDLPGIQGVNFFAKVNLVDCFDLVRHLDVKCPIL